MTQEKNQLESELEELKEKFDVLAPDFDAMKREDQIISEIEKRRVSKIFDPSTYPPEHDDFVLTIKNLLTQITGFEYLSDEELDKELLNCKTEIYAEQISQNSSFVSIEEKISVIKEKWKSVHDFDANRSEPQLFKEEQKKSNTVIHSGAMHKDGKRIASFLRSKTLEQINQK